MALFDKFFSIKRKLDNDYRLTRALIRSCQIKSEQVRLLLFKECDWRGRKLLFDSSTIERVPVLKNEKHKVCQADETACILEVSEGFTYLYKGPAADASVLGEMIFGAVAINCKSVSLKIHIMDEPKRLMCTKVFCVPALRKSSRVDRRASDMNNRSSGNFGNGSKPLNVPLLREEGVSLSFAIDRGDSGYCGDVSPYSSVGSTYDYFSMFDVWGNNTPDELYGFHSPPGRKLSTCSNGSWQRRTFQNLATRFDMGHQSGSSNLLSVPTVTSSTTMADSQVFSGSSTSGTSDSLLSAPAAIKKNKLGLALLFTVGDSSEMDLVRRCVEHSPQLQALVCRLRLATLTAGAGSGFVSTLYRASSDAARWLTDLMYGPRLQPIWLNVATKDARASNAAAENLLSDLCSVLSVGDTKSTNFFISTLLTHVLTYHLGWVTTVSPYDTVDLQKRLELTTGIKKPYNALWAQLSDLCGCIGFPPRSAKTVISGKTNTHFVNRLLLVLTYFFRCGDVKRTEFQYQDCALSKCKVVKVDSQNIGLKRVSTRANNLENADSTVTLKVPTVNTQYSDSSVSTLVASEASIKKSPTLANFSRQLSKSLEFDVKHSTQINDDGLQFETPMTSQLKRNPTVIMSPKSSDSSLCSSVSEGSETEQKVVFVLGDNEKLVGLKNKSNGGKCVKKTIKTHSATNENERAEKKEPCAKDKCDSDKRSDSPSKCCGSTLQHSKPIKHSGFKFEFDKYPQIVTNYMKSKNLELLDRHYLGKPGNLKLDNYQFDPTIVPPIQEERCEACYKCQLMESILQTPTNASEMEYMNDLPQHELQYAREVVVHSETRESTPKTFVRKRVENTLVVNVDKTGDAKSSAEMKDGEVSNDKGKSSEEMLDEVNCSEVPPAGLNCRSYDKVKSSEAMLGEVNSNDTSSSLKCGDVKSDACLDIAPKTTSIVRQKKAQVKEKEKLIQVKQIIELPLPPLCLQSKQIPLEKQERSGFDASLLGGVTDHYVPDLILQGTISKSNAWESELRRDLELTSYLNKALDPPIQAVAIVGDTSNWEVRVLGGDSGASGMSSLVAEMLEALPAMRRAKVPASQCLSFLEGKLRELCILSKTLADLLMSTDFCDIATLTKALNIDVNDVPLLLAIATTHTPQVATRYGISYR